MRRLGGVLAVALTVAGPNAFAENPAAALLGELAPSFNLTDVLSGDEVSLEDLRGRIIVLHFAASW
jgi:hypothetical protein